MTSLTSLPSLPAKHAHFIQHVTAHPTTPIPELVKPYNEYDTAVRRVFAQEPDHPALAENLLNVVPLFDSKGTTDLPIRARDLASESEVTKSQYIMPLKDKHRKPNGSPAVVSNLKDFQTHFNVFSESSLTDLDWNNVVAAGSAVTTSILPIPDKYNDSKRDMRRFFHEDFAPASDVDLFLYGLTEEQMIEKIKLIERCIRDSILTEVSTIRTKNAITIVSQYPTRHVQVVLRRYKSIAEILTGFDVDCSCAAYDGNQVYLAPRAVGAYMTQINRIDLSRRSPSYESRLSKYSHRGFEVFWPDLDRSRIDPSIFERSFTRTVGLARLLVLEKLPKSSDREQYLAQRRRERGRRPLDSYYHSPGLQGNIKNDWQDEVAEWVEEDEVSDYHTFTIPYGQKFHARKIEKLLYTKDLLLNAEWNKPKDREVNLHRHPAFFGSAEDVMHDCCGYCPKPTTPEEEKVAAEESKIYISGDISFISDNPGRQEIGSFNPITDTDWTEMAYIGNTAGLCQAIVDNDFEDVQRWLAQGNIDVNRRDHTGRTPLHLACIASTPEIVQHLVDNGARLISRIADGRTALHLAAARGSVEIVRILLTKSEQNEEEESRKDDGRKGALGAQDRHTSHVDDDEEMIDNPSDDDDANAYAHSHTTGSFVKVNKDEAEEQAMVSEDSSELGPDIYDINVLAWDNNASPLHLAILNGHIAVVEELVTSFGADVLLPVKLVHSYNSSPRAAILTLVLALRLPKDAAKAMTEKLLQLGASPAQADINHQTALHYLAHSGHHEILDIYRQYDQPAVDRALNHLSITGHYYSRSIRSPLIHAIMRRDSTKATKLLEMGAHPAIRVEDYIKAGGITESWCNTFEEQKKRFEQNVTQPVIHAVENDMPSVVIDLLTRGADPSTLTTAGYKVIQEPYTRNNTVGTTLLNYVQGKLKSLRGYDGEVIGVQKPLELDPDDNTYLRGFRDGSYQMWTAKGMLQERREKFAREEKIYKDSVHERDNAEGLAEKRAAIQALLSEYEKLEADLQSRGAKTFKELHPDIEGPAYNHQNSPFHISKEEPYKIAFVFQAKGYTDEVREGFLQLFEAAWTGDVETIKSLTLSTWGPNNERPPLEIGAADQHNYTAFTVAVLRGQLEAAKAILAICIAQHKPDERQKNTRYRMMPDHSDSDEESNASDADSEEIQLDTHVIDAQFTIENVGEARMQVESQISPKSVLQRQCNINLFLEDTQRPEMRINNLIEYAIWKDDIKLLKFLITLGQELVARKKDKQQAPIYTISSSNFVTAIRLGRLRCLEEIIKRTGAGLPLGKLAENCGAEIKEKPKYYQGLSVHGKKRADWAAAGGGVPVARAMDMSPPLLLAAREGNLAAVEWFLGTAPGRYYIEFAWAHKKDVRLKKLSRSAKGMEQSILEWLGSRRDLVLHCAVLSKYTEESARLVAYLANTMPHILEVKSMDEYTPLSIAFHKHKFEFAKILIKAGANQAVRSNEGKNLLHLTLSPNIYLKDYRLNDMLNLINPFLIPSMLIERCSSHPGSLTPLALWVSRGMSYDEDTTRSTLRTILDLAEPTGQKHLELLDGSGNTLLHTAVNSQWGIPLQLCLERRPDLLYRENAVGSTPAEVAETKWVANMTEDPPRAPEAWYEQYGSSGRSDWSLCEIVSKAPGQFVSKPVTTSWTEKKIYKLCTPKDEAGKGTKRKLVSLFDANEVAKRLALGESNPDGLRRYSRRRCYQEEDEEDKRGDEVTRWL
ncbi:ankyrin repeat-containing domain protein [Aspergillus varians]